MRYGNCNSSGCAYSSTILKKTGNSVVLKRIALLLKAIEVDPFSGIGKPEKLKHNLSGKWSRHIDKEHRLIYEIKDDSILIHSLQGHY